MLLDRVVIYYTESMTTRWAQLRSILYPLAGSLLALGVLSACSSFSTPLSSDNLIVGAVGSKARLPSSDRGPMLQDNTMSFDWPVDRARMTRGFLPNLRRPHLGIDLAAPRGTPILAAQAGTVIYAGREFKGYGKMVMLESGDGWATLYAHFDKILVAEGQKVRQGEVIGAMGRTGRATGVHLHFEIRKDRGPIDPLPLLPFVPTAAR
jgi:murein DD-endopeptidase MepM/ murein hydrolase activator NlpD